MHPNGVPAQAAGSANRRFGLHQPRHQVPHLRRAQPHLRGLDGGERADDVATGVLGALPTMGSNMETPCGLMLPPAAMPMPPWIIAPRSVMMSPNMFSTTMTSNHSGFLTNHMQVASTWAYSRRISG